MRSVSQVIVGVLMIVISIAASSLLAFMVTGVMASYKPSQNIIARVGDVNFELTSIDTYSYRFIASVDLINLGTEPYTVSYGSIVVLVKGWMGEGKVYECPLRSGVVLVPGETKTLFADCIIPRDDLQTLFGSRIPPADDVKKSVSSLYIEVYLQTSSGGGSAGGPGSSVSGYLLT